MYTAAVMATAISQNAFAQVKLEVTPYFASYYAANYTAHASSDQNERQEAGPGLGINAAYHFTRLLGVQGSVTYVWSGIIPKQPTSASTISILNPLPGALTFASARLTVQPRRSNYYLAVGPGFVRRSGKAWDDPAWVKLTNITMVAAFGIRAHITPEWEFNIGVDGQFYMSDPDGPGTYYQRRMQRDVLLTIGVPFALIGR